MRLEFPSEIVDLGCGPGNATAVLRERWPNARITGVDSSPEMLEKARTALPDASFVEADIAHWQPARPADLIFSNAALHWLPDHERLFPQLLDMLPPGGVLAVQMPQTRHGRWREILREIAQEPPWSEGLAPILKSAATGAAEEYYLSLQGRCAQLDIWESEYLHAMEGEDPVAAWTKGAGLRPYLSALEKAEAGTFFRRYAERVRIAYPAQPNGITLFPFRRLFIVAGRA